MEPDQPDPNAEVAATGALIHAGANAEPPAEHSAVPSPMNMNNINAVAMTQMAAHSQRQIDAVTMAMDASNLPAGALGAHNNNSTHPADTTGTVRGDAAANSQHAAERSAQLAVQQAAADTPPLYANGHTSSLAGAHDQLFQAMSGSASQGNLCFRCKFDDHLLTACIFESNVFTAKRTLPCRSCNRTVHAGVTLVTRMTRGRLAGSFIHRECARQWYEAHPREQTANGMPILRFHMPCDELVAYLERFVAGEGPLFHFSAVAGAGKSNAILYVVSRLRELGFRFIVLVFSLAAKEELISRGLLVSEVSNFHAFVMQAYRRWIDASLNEHAVMASDAAPGPLQRTEATIAPQIMRLVLSFFLRGHECCKALTKLLRPFVADLCNQARTHGFGTPDGPSNFDTDALSHLVKRYKLEPKLESAWDGQLNQPEKLQVDRSLGASPADRLEYAINVTANVLELAIVMATSTAVDGETCLYNEVQRKSISFPATDVKGVETIALAKELNLGTVDRVLVDECQDANACELQIIEAVKSIHGGSVGMFGDEDQSAYLWLGVERWLQEEYLKDAIPYIENRNRRSGELILAEAQPFLDQLGRGVKLVAARGVAGAVEHGPFWAHPINAAEKTLIIGRTTKHVIAFFAVMVSLGYSVSMHGMDNTATSIATALHDLDCSTLAQVKQRVTAYLAMHVASNKSMVYEMHCALNELVPVFLAKNPTVNDTFPGSIKHFEDWVIDLFAPKDDGVGEIQMSTIHASKGKEAPTVYIINPSLTPLKERLDGMDWERFEELCLAYIARTRAMDRLVYLPDLEITSRTEILSLFKKPITFTAELDEGGGSQGSATSSVSTASAASSSALLVAAEDFDAPAQIKEALLTLELPAMPTTFAELDAAVRKRLLATRPDNALGSEEGKANQQAVLAARTTIRTEMTKTD